MDASAYLSQLLGLLPPGDALAREPGSRLERLLSVPAAELARVDGRVEALLLESDPARTTEMLADWERALGLPDECYPNETFSRASRAWYFDGAGVLREAAVDEPRYLYDALGQRTEAVLVEAAATNLFRNSRAEGAAVGGSGVLPLNWFFNPNINSITHQVVGAGVEDGIPYVDIRLFGSNSNGSWPFIAFDNAWPATAVGETVTASVFCRRLSGTQLEPVVLVAEHDGAAFLTSIQTSLQADQPALRLNRGALTRLISVPGVAIIISVLYFPPTAPVVDATFRIGCPQLEKGPVATSPILNPVGAPAATTRAADQRYVATVAERRARVLARLIERFEPTPVAIIGLAARLGNAVTLTEFTQFDCEDTCEQAVRDQPWAHAFQVAGSAQQVVEFTCEDTSETPISQWRTGAYECAIRRFAPAHTVPIFTYT
ncbi:MAG: DUF2313 domain-containing protein [Roseomonas sp.]|nr:DUF2313 domain-containing protein [Roseomonas sp.]